MKRVLALGAVVTVVFAAAGGSARGATSACPTSNAPNELVLTGGSGQQAQLGKEFGQSLQVRLANTNGCPLTGNLAGVTVNFDAPGSGASGIFASSGSREAYVGTDSEGLATAPPFTANFTVGDYAVDAHSDYGTVGIELSNTANGLRCDRAGGVEHTGGCGELPVRAAAAGADHGCERRTRPGRHGELRLVPGATGAGAMFLGAGPASAVTNADGVATAPPLLANGVPGKFAATASTDGLSSVALFALDNHAAAMTLAR